MVAGPGEDLREMIARLEQQELDCQVMRTNKQWWKTLSSFWVFCRQKIWWLFSLSDGKWQCACPSLHGATCSLPCRGRAHKVGQDAKNNFITASLQWFSHSLGQYLWLNWITFRAKFLWKRIPAASKQDGELPRVWAIGKGEQSTIQADTLLNEQADKCV